MSERHPSAPIGIRGLDEENPTIPGFLRMLCCLFCCPPCPSRIVDKLAFYKPELTYDIKKDKSGNLSIFHWIDGGDAPKNLIEARYLKTQRGNTIATIHMKPNADPKFTILYSHGNADELGRLSEHLFTTSQALNCNYVCYDYSGYGKSSGKPSEKNMYADIRAAFHLLTTEYGVPLNKVILHGQSIGTVAAIHLASTVEVAGVILEGPLLSAFKLACPNTNCCFDSLSNISKMDKVSSPVLIIHAVDDKTVPIDHGVTLLGKCQNPVEPLWLNGGHCDYTPESRIKYNERLKRFVDSDLQGGFVEVDLNDD